VKATSIAYLLSGIKTKWSLNERMNALRPLTSLIIFILFASSVASADTIKLKNGDHITGTIKAITDGKLTLATEYAGEIKIDLKLIADLQSDSSLCLKASSDEAVCGQIKKLVRGKVEIADSSDKVREVEIDKVVSLADAKSDSKSKSALASASPVATDVPSLISEIFSDWKGGVDFGFSLSRGNTRSGQLSLFVNSKRSFGRDTLQLNGNALYGSVNGAQSISANRFDVRYDHFLSDRAFVYFVTEAETNKPKRLELRNAHGGGFGWQIAKSDRVRFSTFGGVGTINQDFDDAPSTFGIEGRMGQEMTLSLSDKMRIINNYEILMNVSDHGSNRSQFNLTFQAPLVENIVLGVRYYNRYDSRPLPDTQSTDSGVVTTLGYRFDRK